LVSISLITINTNATVVSVPKLKEKTEQFSENLIIKNDTVTKQDSTEITIKGKLVDKETKVPLPFANIIISGTKIGISSDLDGEFE
jgi:hypothetical protein